MFILKSQRYVTFFAIKAKTTLPHYFSTESVLPYTITILCKIVTDICILQISSKN